MIQRGKDYYESFLKGLSIIFPINICNAKLSHTTASRNLKTNLLKHLFTKSVFVLHIVI